jgi:hypothetical protein
MRISFADDQWVAALVARQLGWTPTGPASARNSRRAMDVPVCSRTAIARSARFSGWATRSPSGHEWARARAACPKIFGEGCTAHGICVRDDGEDMQPRRAPRHPGVSRSHVRQLWNHGGFGAAVGSAGGGPHGWQETARFPASRRSRAFCRATASRRTFRSLQAPSRTRSSRRASIRPSSMFAAPNGIGRRARSPRLPPRRRGTTFKVYFPRTAALAVLATRPIRL